MNGGEMTEQTHHEHCWHSTGIQLTSLPPWDVQACCHCGVKRNVRLGQMTSPEGHGPFFPKPLAITVSKAQPAPFDDMDGYWSD